MKVTASDMARAQVLENQLSGNISIARVTEYLKWSAEAVAKYYRLSGNYSTVVILGRDCWPIFPLLKKKGIPTQYFLFSRLQVGEEGTKAAWLREVPPHALVLDSGYQGSIPKAIEKIDSTTSGVLICSADKYDQLDLGANVPNAYIVEDIECIPKLVGRCTRIEANGLARCPQDKRDQDEAMRGHWSPRDILLYNVLLCRELGISDEWAAFTGISPEQRLGNTKSELSLHYAKIAAERAALPAPVTVTSKSGGITVNKFATVSSKFVNVAALATPPVSTYFLWHSKDKILYVAKGYTVANHMVDKKGYLNLGTNKKSAMEDLHYEGIAAATQSKYMFDMAAKKLAEGDKEVAELYASYGKDNLKEVKSIQQALQKIKLVK